MPHDPLILVYRGLLMILIDPQSLCRSRHGCRTCLLSMTVPKSTLVEVYLQVNRCRTNFSSRVMTARGPQSKFTVTIGRIRNFNTLT